jgi:hypothetical protein
MLWQSGNKHEEVMVPKTRTGAGKILAGIARRMKAVTIMRTIMTRTQFTRMMRTWMMRTFA